MQTPLALSVVDQAPGNTDALVEANEMRAGIDMDVMAGRLDCGAEKGAGRSLAVGAGHVKDGRHIVLRIAQPGEQLRDPLQPQHIGARR